LAKSIGGINYDFSLNPPCGTLVPNSPRAGMQQGLVIFKWVCGGLPKVTSNIYRRVYMSA